MQHVGIKVDERQCFENGFGEERKAFAVVEMTVKTFTLEIILVVHEIVSYAVVNRFVNAAVLTTPTQIDERRSDKLERIAISFFDFLFVERNDNSAIVTERIESLRKRTGDIAQAARPDERHCF